MQQYNVCCNTEWQRLRDPNAVDHTTTTANAAFAALRFAALRFAALRFAALRLAALRLRLGHRQLAMPQRILVVD